MIRAIGDAYLKVLSGGALGLLLGKGRAAPGRWRLGARGSCQRVGIDIASPGTPARFGPDGGSAAPRSGVGWTARPGPGDHSRRSARFSASSPPATAPAARHPPGGGRRGSHRHLLHPRLYREPGSAPWLPCWWRSGANRQARRGRMNGRGWRGSYRPRTTPGPCDRPHSPGSRATATTTTHPAAQGPPPCARNRASARAGS